MLRTLLPGLRLGIHVLSQFCVVCCEIEKGQAHFNWVFGEERAVVPRRPQSYRVTGIRHVDNCGFVE